METYNQITEKRKRKEKNKSYILGMGFFTLMVILYMYAGFSLGLLN